MHKNPLMIEYKRPDVKEISAAGSAIVEKIFWIGFAFPSMSTKPAPRTPANNIKTKYAKIIDAMGPAIHHAATFHGFFILLPNVEDQTRPALARNVRLGAHSVTA
jgi:hypothetical protein